MAKDPGIAKKDLEKKQIITIVSLFVVLFLVFYFFVLRGGGEEPAGLGPVPVVQTTETPGDLGGTDPSPDPGGTPDPGETPDPGHGPTNFPTNTLRDPFEPPPGADAPAGNPFEENVTPEVTPTP